jgi:hypothetical protein
MNDFWNFPLNERITKALQRKTTDKREQLCCAPHLKVRKLKLWDII